MRATTLAVVALLVGQAAAHCNYPLSEGESLFSVAENFDIKLDELTKLNTQIKNPEEVLAGQVIKIPCKASKQGSNLMDLLEHRNETFILSEAIAAAGLDETLRKTKGATLFAPTDKAFEGLLAELNVTPEALFNNTALLTDVLQFHLLGDKVLSKDLKATQEVETFLEGRGFTVEKGADGVTIKTPSGKVAKVVTANLKAGSNVVHIIDAVLVPGAKVEKPAAAAGTPGSKLPKSCEHTIKKGDTIFDLSKKYDVPEAELVKLNPTVTDPAKIVAGNKLKLCDGAAATAEAPKPVEAVAEAVEEKMPAMPGMN